MRTVKIILSVVFVTLLSCPPGDVSAQDLRKVELDPAMSTIGWVGRKVTGFHTGTVALKNGQVLLKGNMVQSGKFAIDVGQVVVADIEDPGYNAKLVKHLKSADFFAVSSFPLIEFSIESAEPLEKPLGTGENTLIKGVLDIKGISNRVEFPALVDVKDGVAHASGKVKLDRTKWEIQYGSGKFFQGLGDKLIYDDFEVDFTVKGKVIG